MSENFANANPNENIKKSTSLMKSIDILECNSKEFLSNLSGNDIRIAYDHMYTTNNQQQKNGLGAFSSVAAAAAAAHNKFDSLVPCHDQSTTESEVRFLKDFLLIHLDLIQQQNDDIVNKESTINLLQEENQRLREQIKSLTEAVAASQAIKTEASDAPSEPAAAVKEEIVTFKEEEQLPVVEQSKQSTSSFLEQPKEVVSSKNCDSIEECKGSEAEETSIDVENVSGDKEEPRKQSELTSLEFNSENSYIVHSNSSNNIMKDLKLSIRRKRANSSPIAVHNGLDSPEITKKKTKRLIKNDEVLACNEHYFTQVGEKEAKLMQQQDPINPAFIPNSFNLEVPRWRVKVYTSCYSMEGTENLEDKVFLRRHSRMENDEKRRKRWDVQRIREQRIIEKLKQRQVKIDSNSKCPMSEPPPALESLLPSIDDLKFIEMCDTLPVSAFGCPISKIQPSTFSLPWVENVETKKPTSKKSNSLNNSSRRKRNKR